MTWDRLAIYWKSFTSYFAMPNQEPLPTLSHPPMIDSEKLRGALPEIIGKTIAHVMIAERSRGHSQLFLIFSDETHYEFYGLDSMSGIRGVYPGGLDSLESSVEDAEAVTVVSPGGRG